MEYSSSEEEDHYEFILNENNHEAPIQSCYKVEAKGESWCDDINSDSDFNEEYAMENPEPEPPDQVRYSSSHTRWYDEEQGSGELNLKSPNSKWSPTYPTPSKPNCEVSHEFKYKSNDEFCFYEFSGSKRDYLQWEYNMDQYFKYHSIPRVERLNYCLGQLKGEAKRWWYQEEEYRWYYKEPAIIFWEQLKWIMRKRYAPVHLNQPGQNIHLPKESTQGNETPTLVQNANSQSVKRQGKYSVLNTPLELMSSKCKNREHSAKEFSSKKTLSSTSSSCKKNVTQVSVKRGSQPDHKEGNKDESDQTNSVATGTRRAGEQCKSSNLSKIIGTTCYRCHKRGHYAVVCPSRPVDNSHTLEQKLGSTSDCLVPSNPEIPISSMMHLSLPKSFDPGITQEEETTSTEKILFQIAIGINVSSYISRPISIVINSGIMHLLLPLSVSKGTGAMEKYKCLEEATSRPITFSGQHQLPPKRKDHQDKSCNVLNIDDTICYRHRNTVHFDRLSFTHKLFTTLLLSPKEKSREVVENNELYFQVSNAFIMHLSLSRVADTGIRIIREAPKRVKRSRGVIMSLLIKEKPPDIYHSRKSHHTRVKPKPQGKCLNPFILTRSHMFSDDAGRVDTTYKHQMNQELKEKPPDQASNTFSVSQVRLSSTHFVSNDSRDVLKELMSLEKNEEPICHTSKTEFVKTGAKEFSLCSLIYLKGSIMHLFLAKNVDLNAGTKVKHKTQELPDSLYHIQEEFKDETKSEIGDFTKEATFLPQKVNIKPWRGVIATLLIKEKPPDAHIPSYMNRQKDFGHGKFLDSYSCKDTNLLYLDAGYIVSRSKLFQEGEYDEDIKSSSTKEHETRSLQEKSMKLRRAKETCKLSSAPLETKSEHSSSTTNWRSQSTHLELTTKKNQPERIPDEEDIEDTFWKIFNGRYRDLRPLIESFRPNQDEPSCKYNCFGFSTHQRKTESWFHNQINFGSRVIEFTNRVNRSFLDLDIGALIEGFRSNQKEIRYKPTCFGILTQPGSSSSWIYSNTGFGLKDIQLLNQKMLNLPYLGAHGFDHLQTRLWRPGETSKPSGDTSDHPGESSRGFPYTSNHWIRRIPLFPNLPYPEAFTLGVITHQRLVPYQDCSVLCKEYDDQDVPRKLTYTLKPSRYKANITALESSHLTTQIFQRLYSILSRFL